MKNIPLRSFCFLAVTGLVPTALWAAGETVAESPVVLDPVEIIATADSLNPLASPTAGIMGDQRSLLDTPRAATTLTAARIEQQGIDSLPKVAAQSAGVSAPASYGLLTTPVIRGDTAETYVNGQRLGYNNYGYLPSFNSVEAIDVVRGPASAVFGAGYLVGGYVNYRTKQPSFDATRTVLTTKIGTWVPGAENSFANATLQIDHTAPLSDTLAYRFSYEGKGGDTFYKSSGVDDDRQDFFFALAWRPTDGLRIDANAQVFWQKTPQPLGVNRVTQNLIDHGIYQSDLGPVKLDRSAVLAQPADTSDAWVGRAQVAVTREFSPDVLLVNRTLFERLDRKQFSEFGYHEAVAATTIENRSELNFGFEGLGLEQTALVGFALRYEGRNSYADYDYGAFLPIYDITNPATITQPPVMIYEESRAQLLNPSLFWQHDVALTEQLTFTAGLREDFYFGKITGSSDDGWGTNAGSDQIDFQAFSQSASLTWRPRQDLSLYVTHNRMQTLGTNGSAVGGGYFFTGPSVNGGDFRQPSVLTEVGAKANLFDGRLFAGLAVFQQDRSRNDFAAPADIRVRGIEFEAVWQPTTAWAVFGNATLQDGHYQNAALFQLADSGSPTFGETAQGDHELVGFSNLMLNGGVQYRLDHGFGVGLSGAWQSEQNVNIATPTSPQLTIPAQFQIDAVLFYETQDWSASVGFLNLTNERNWIHNGDVWTGAALISQSLPFRIEATLRMRF